MGERWPGSTEEDSASKEVMSEKKDDSEPLTGNEDSCLTRFTSISQEGVIIFYRWPVLKQSKDLQKNISYIDGCEMG